MRLASPRMVVVSLEPSCFRLSSRSHTQFRSRATESPGGISGLGPLPRRAPPRVQGLFAVRIGALTVRRMDALPESSGAGAGPAREKPDHEATREPGYSGTHGADEHT